MLLPLLNSVIAFRRRGSKDGSPFWGSIILWDGVAIRYPITIPHIKAKCRTLFEKVVSCLSDNKNCEINAFRQVEA